MNKKKREQLDCFVKEAEKTLKNIEKEFFLFATNKK